MKRLSVSSLLFFMKAPITILFILIQSFFEVILAQEILPGQNKLNDTSGGLISQIPPTISQEPQENYLNDDWVSGKIYLSNGDSITGYPLKLSLSTFFINIKVGNSVRIMNLHLTDSIEITSNKRNKTYYTLRKQSDGKERLYYKMKTGCRYDLYKAYESEEIKGGYIVQLDSEPRPTDFVISKAYFLVTEDHLFKVRRRINKMKNILGEHFDQLKQYVRNQNLKLTEEEHIIRFYEYYVKISCL